MKATYDILCIGMALIDSIIKGFDPKPIYNGGCRAGSGELHVGGEAVNEALAAAKLGMHTGILCHIGNDLAGRLLEEALLTGRVDTALAVHDTDNHPTPVTTMFVREDGNRTTVTNAAHKYNFHPEWYLDEYAKAKAVLLGSLFRAPFDDPGIIRRVSSWARETGAVVFADTKLPNFRELTVEDIRDSLPLIDFITPNEDEARHFTGKECPEDMAEVFYEMGVRNVVVKLGERGCYYRTPECKGFLPAFEIEAADATGAGDNFLAGLASEILQGKSIQEALCFASACGAICTTAVGAGTALKDRQQVLDFIENHRK